MKTIITTTLSIFLLIVILGGGALLLGDMRSTFAQGVVRDDQSSVSEASIVSENELLQISDEIAKTGKQGLGLDLQQQGETITQEISSLIEKWIRVRAKAGWVHVVTQRKEDYDSASFLPKEYIQDDWYLLDDQGYQVKGAFIQRDLNGNPIQVSVLRDNTWYNLTHKDMVAVPEEALPLTLRLDFGFPKRATQSTGIDKKGTTLDGKSVFLYTIIDELESAVEVSDFNSPLVAIITKAYVDPASGALLLYEDHMILANGEERVRSSVHLTSYELGVQPSAEVLSFIEATYTTAFKDPFQGP